MTTEKEQLHEHEATLQEVQKELGIKHHSQVLAIEKRALQKVKVELEKRGFSIEDLGRARVTTWDQM